MAAKKGFILAALIPMIKKEQIGMERNGEYVRFLIVAWTIS